MFSAQPRAVTASRDASRQRGERSSFGSPDVLELSHREPRSTDRTNPAASRAVIYVHCATPQHDDPDDTVVSRHDAPKYRQPSRHAEPGTGRLPNKTSDRLHFESAHATCGRRGSRAVYAAPGIMSREDRAPGATARSNGCATAACGKRRGIIGRSASPSAHRSIRRAGVATS